MKTIYGVSNLTKRLHHTVAVIGVFDGLHRGHQYLIKKAVSSAQKLRRKSVCITFHPHPQNEPYLISLKHRLNLIAALGIDYCLVVSFNEKFAKITAESFIKNILVKWFGPVYIFVGRKFRFGYKAKGDAALLASLGKECGFTLEPVKELHIAGKKASSRCIRDLIRAGRLLQARKLLGRCVSVLGTVVKGSRRGKMLGYPTANINPHHEVLPKEGVYAVKALYNQKEYKGISNIGHRPTFESSDENKTIEAHLFDFHKNIYGEDIEIQFIRRIRDEKKFPSQASLTLQIRKDRQKALQYLSEIK